MFIVFLTGYVHAPHSEPKRDVRHAIKEQNTAVSSVTVALPVCAAGLLLLYVITGFLIVPRIVNTVLPEKLSAVTGQMVTLESSAFIPFTLEITLKKLVILERDQTPFASIGRFYANVQLLPPVVGNAVLK